MTLEERIAKFKDTILNKRTNYEAHLFVCGESSSDVSDALEESLDIINELQQKNDLLQLDFNAAQEIMGCMNQEKEELIKALNFIRSSDSSTESAAKAIEMLKKYGNV